MEKGYPMQEIINGLKISYKTAGEGAPVLFLHGWGGCADSFAPVFNELSRSRKVYAIDFPGFGESDQPESAYHVDEYMEITAEFMRRMGIEGCDVICHSFGGRVTILLAATYPDMINRAVLTDAAGLIPKRTLKYYIKVYRYKLAKKLIKVRPVKGFLKVLGVDLEKKVSSAGSEDYRKLSGIMRQTFVNVVNQDLRPYLKDIKASCLLIYGENDKDTPVYFGEIMEKEIKDAGLVVLKDAGHFSYLDQYPRYMSIVKSFLEVKG